MNQMTTPIFDLKNKFIWDSGIMQKFRKKNDTVPRKPPDRRKDGWKDGRMDRPYFIEPFQLMPGVQKY